MDHITDDRYDRYGDMDVDQLEAREMSRVHKMQVKTDNSPASYAAYIPGTPECAARQAAVKARYAAKG